jgi:Domain of unknown function (DUF4386)
MAAIARHRRPDQTTNMEKENQMQTTLQRLDGSNSYRKTAIAVGVIYLAGMVVGVGGNVIVQSILGAPDHLLTLPANSMLVAVGAMLWLLAVAGDAAHGILMFPVLKPYNERIAFGYFGARIMDAVFVAVMALLILFQIPLGSEYAKAGATDASYLQGLSSVLGQAQLYAYHLGMITVGFAGLMLNYVFHRAQLLPRILGVWGLIGYAVILCGSVLEVLGVDLTLSHTIPGGLWELFIGVWLIAKGFSKNPSPVATKRTTSSTPSILPSPAVRSATA